MGKARQTLKQVLKEYGINQYSLSVEMDVERNNVHRWVNEKRDPTAETVVEIVRALKKLKPEASKAFIECYLGDEIENV
ncbi:MAG: helix-turn-helix transcriptional regulator [Cyanobacteria bacterium J06626_4]